MAKTLTGQRREEITRIPRHKIILWIGIFLFGWLTVSYMYNQLTTAVLPKAPPQPKAAVAIPKELQNIPPLSEADKSEIDNIAQTEIALYFERSGDIRSNKQYEVVHSPQDIVSTGLESGTTGIYNLDDMVTLRKVNTDIAVIKWYYYNSGQDVSGEPNVMTATVKKETSSSSWKYYNTVEIYNILH